MSDARARTPWPPSHAAPCELTLIVLHPAHFTLSSDPSPRYVQSVADAFRSGSHGGISYTGKYGDLGAALAAILLDREARSATLDLDPGHGRLREPLLKMMHLMRSMQMSPRHGREIELKVPPHGSDAISLSIHAYQAT